MPGPYLYPGVYIEEIPSGVRPIAGASVSDTAFVDWFPRGPVDRAVRITSLVDFDRVFGGLHPQSEASYAVQQFFVNGGTVAWIVRALAPDAVTADRTIGGSQVYPGGSGAGSGGATVTDILTVSAASPGDWGNALQVAIDSRGLGDPNAFNLVVREVTESGGRRTVNSAETYRNLSVDSTRPNFVDTVIGNASQLVRTEYAGLGAVPGATGADVIGAPNDADWLILGQDGYQSGQDVLPAPPTWGNVPYHAGSDGTTPDLAGWIQSVGSNALLGVAVPGEQPVNRGIHELERIAPNIFNLLCLPGASKLSSASQQTVWADAATLCESRRAFVLVDVDESVATIQKMIDWMNSSVKPQSDHAAVYFPRLQIPDPINANTLRSVGPSGTVAGIYARTDGERGVWKAPAGIDAGLRNATLPALLTDEENAALGPIGVNALRSFPLYGNVVWGARTLEGSDQEASEWKYIPVRRTALFIEESLYQGLKWVVFEPNDAPLWAQIRLNVGSFMQGLFRQGAFAGSTPRDAYLVKCDSDTTTQADIDLGIVNIVVGFAPLKPAEFVVIQLQQLAGQVQI